MPRFIPFMLGILLILMRSNKPWTLWKRVAHKLEMSTVMWCLVDCEGQAIVLLKVCPWYASCGCSTLCLLNAKSNLVCLKINLTIQNLCVCFLSRVKQKKTYSIAVSTDHSEQDIYREVDVRIPKRGKSIRFTLLALDK